MQTTLNVFSITAPEPRNPDADPDRHWFVVRPSALYPAMLLHIQATLASQVRPPGALGVYYDRAAALPPDVWALAPDQPQRAEALDICRLWFTELLHARWGHAPIGLHILNDPEWKP